jgi:hypothetical protein
MYNSARLSLTSLFPLVKAAAETEGSKELEDEFASALGLSVFPSVFFAIVVPSTDAAFLVFRKCSTLATSPESGIN